MQKFRQRFAMPLYDYECACGRGAAEFRAVDQRNDGPQCECGAIMVKVFSKAAAIGDLEPYFDDNLQTYIKSRKHRVQVMRDKDVAEKFGKGWK
jgi:putative FmdB family regulatory protein